MWRPTVTWNEDELMRSLGGIVTAESIAASERRGGT